jgi:hypothetical protein
MDILLSSVEYFFRVFHYLYFIIVDITNKYFWEVTAAIGLALKVFSDEHNS